MRKSKSTGIRSVAIAALIVALTIALIGSSVSAMEITNSDSTEVTDQQTETQETVIHEDAVSFTPDGNLTLIDDFIRSDESDKQFITVKTKDESVFYIVIDRSANRENVYFLNLVDDQDLISILNDEGLTEEIETITKLPEPQASEQTKSSDTEPKTPDSSPAAMQLIVILVFVAAIGGAAFWLIRSKPFQKQRKKEVSIPEYLYEEPEPDPPTASSDMSSYDSNETDEEEQETSTDQEREDQ